MSPTRRATARIETLEHRRMLAAFTPGAALDTTYGPAGNGLVMTDSSGPSGWTERLVAVRPLDGGKVLVVGTNLDGLGNARGTLARLNADGSRDTTFGEHGIGIVRIPSPETLHVVAAAFLENGKVLVAGNAMRYVSSTTTLQPSEQVLMRFNPDGTLDTTFGAGGTRGDNSVVPTGTGITVLPGPSRFNSLLVLPDGKLLAGGSAVESGRNFDHGALWRFNADGTPDATFGQGGRVTRDFGSTAGFFRVTVAMPDGRAWAETNLGAFLLRPNGTAEREQITTRPLARLAGDQVLGAWHWPNGVQLTRFNPDGSRDNTFGTEGTGVANVLLAGAGPIYASATFEPADVVVQDDGKIIVGGTATFPGTDLDTHQDFLLMRLNPDASLDETFGINGVVGLTGVVGVTDTNRVDTLADLALAPGNRLMAAGISKVYFPGDTRPGGDDFLLARYALDPGIVVDADVQQGPMPERTPRRVSAGGSYGPQGAAGVASYAWDANFHGGHFTADATGASTSLTVTDDDHAQRVVLRVTTTDGLQALVPVPAEVTNVPPTLSWLFADGAVAVGRIAQVNGFIVDPGADAHTVTLSYGDGTPSETRDVSTSRSFSINHAYPARGTFPLTVTIRDDDGGVFSTTRQVTVGDIAGAVFEDANDNRLRESSDPPVPGATVFLDTNRDGVHDEGELSTTTDAAGFYHFSGLAPGVYRPAYAVPAGWRYVPPQGNADIMVSETQGDVRDFGQTKDARITGFVFTDDDGDGVRDANEFWHADATPYIDLDNDGFFDVDEPQPMWPGGFNYVFNNLSPGTYTVRLGPHVPNQAPQETDSYPDYSVQTFPAGPGGVPSNAGYTVTVGEAEVAAGHDFGATYAFTSARGSVFNDTDRDGTRDTGEQYLARRIIFVDADDDGVMDPEERRVFTNASGSYTIGLPPGTYPLRQVVPPGWAQSAPADGAAHRVTVPAGGWPLPQADFGAHPAGPATVVGRHVFYNNSAFDPRPQFFSTAGLAVANDHAIAPDKRALLPGQSPSFANVTSYTKGINGVVIDVAGVPTVSVVGVSPADFAFAVGRFRNGSVTWEPLDVPPSISHRRGSGVDFTDRIVLTWPDGAIRNTWLRVTLKAGARSGLAADDVFSFGNLVGDTGGRGASGSVASVDALDLLRTRRAASPTASITNPHDHNRDGRVSPADYAIARSNLSRRLGTIPLPVAAPLKVREGEVRDLLSS